MVLLRQRRIHARPGGNRRLGDAVTRAQAGIISPERTKERNHLRPRGYANCIRAEQPDSVLLVFSGKILSEAQADSWRYPADYWFDWSAVK